MMPESLLAAQREAIARAIRKWRNDQSIRGGASVTIWPDEIGDSELAAADAVLVLVGAWLVGAVQAERERIGKHLTDANRIGGPESLQAFSDAYVKEAGLAVMPFPCPSAVIQGCAAINRRALAVVSLGSEAS